MPKTLIFGATGAIGSAIAQQLSSQRKQLHLAGRNEAELMPLAQSCGASYSLFDAEDSTSISDVVAEAAAIGGIDGVVWAVGNILLKPLPALSAQELHHCFQLNLFGAVQAIQSAAPSLKANSGSVLLFSSVAARYGFTAHAAIGAAKAAVEGLVVSLAAEFAPDIRINAIAPSLSQSKMASPIISNPQMQKALAASHPLGRLGEAQDFAPLSAMLLDNTQSGWITGQIFAVDGGRSSVQAGARAKS